VATHIIILRPDLACCGAVWVPGHAGVQGNEITDELTRGGSALKFVGPEPALGVSRQDIRKRIRRGLVNQHWT
jgi:ribonuclease HI